MVAVRLMDQISLLSEPPSIEESIQPLHAKGHLNGWLENLRVCSQHLSLIEVTLESEGFLGGPLPLCRCPSDSKERLQDLA